jgi:hypothetical protein
MRIPLRKIREQSRARRPLPARPGRSPLAHTEDRAMERFVTLIVAEGRHPAAAAAEVGIPAELATWYVRNSASYQVARDRVLARLANGGADLRTLLEREPAAMIAEGARSAALVQSRMVAGEEDLSDTKVRLTDSLLDRAGWRAPSRSIVKQEIVLSDEDRRAIALYASTGKLDAEPARDAAYAKFGYALEKPKRASREGAFAERDAGTDRDGGESLGAGPAPTPSAFDDEDR